MKQIAPILAFAFMASCDVFPRVARSVDPGFAFEPARAQALLRQHPDHDPTNERLWNGEKMRSEFSRGNAHAKVRYEKGQDISIWSLWPSNPPDDPTIQDTHKLQIELIQLLRQTCSSIPQASEWSLSWLSLDAQPDDATDRPSATADHPNR